MSGCLDVNHIIKRYCYHAVTSGRFLQFGSFCVELSVLLKGGLPSRCYTAVDLQSDRDAARKMCPGHLPGHPLEDGCVVAMFLQCLVSSCWGASENQRRLVWALEDFGSFLAIWRNMENFCNNRRVFKILRDCVTQPVGEQPYDRMT